LPKARVQKGSARFISPLQPFLTQEVFHPGDVILAILKVAGGQDFALQGDGGLDAFDDEFAEGTAHAADGDLAGGTGDDELGDHRIVIRRHFIPGIYVAVHADAAATGGVPKIDLAGAGGEIAIRVFGVDAALDGVTASSGIEHVLAQRQTSGDADLLLDEVAAIDFFRDRMLHLDAGVHLHEVEVFTVVIDEELDGAAVLIADLFADTDGGIAHLFAQGLGHLGAGALFDDLLVTPLHGAVALAEMDNIAESIRDDLKLDVMRLFDQLFHVHGAVAKALEGLQRSGLEAGDQSRFIEHGAHATTTTAGARLDDDGITDLASPHEGFFLVMNEAIGAGGDGHASGTGGRTGYILVPHHGDDAGTGSDELDFALFADIRELGLFREESVAGMDGVHIGDLRRADDAADLQVALAAGAGADADGFIRQMDVHGVHVCLGINGDGFDIELFAGADDADGDLTTIGDEDFAKHEGRE